MYFLRSGTPFVRLLVIFMLGIALGLSFDFKPSLVMIFLAVSLYLLIYFLERKRFNVNLLKSFTAYLVLFLFGIYSVDIHTERKSASHYVHSLDSIECYKARVVSVPEPTEKTFKVLLEIKSIKKLNSEWMTSSGKMLGYLQKDSLNEVRKGDLLLISGTPSLPMKPANPGQFDYARYLNRQNIYAVHYIVKGSLLKTGHEEDILLIRLADSFRSFCEEIIRAGIKGENEYELTTALLLGVKAGLNEKLYNAYSATGTVHALAVSGMHVSLIYLIVVFVFGFIKKINYGKIIFTVLSISIFWFYALVTGFSPSVVRAVTMFSVFLLAGVLKRNPGIYNTLAFSAFVILCVEPFWLLDIGFQFSFLAVVGIAYIFPVVESWWEPGNSILKKVWSLACISSAAQLAVAPLSIYYFHSFPLLFLPFNMLIVPISSLAIYTGLAGLIVYKINFLSSLFLLITDYLVRLMNYFVSLPIESEYLKADFLFLNFFELIVLYLFIVSLVFSFKNKRYKSFVYSFGFLFLFSVSMFYNSFLHSKKRSITVYSVKGETVASFIQEGNALVLSDNKLLMEDKIFKFNVYNHLAEERINNLAFIAFQETSLLVKKNYSYGQLIVWQGKKILRINKYEEENFPFGLLKKLDYIIVSDNQFYHRLKQSKKCFSAIVLIDSSVKEKSSAGAEDFYDIRKQGAFTCSE
jgi:competence protein ComEC